MRKRFSKKIYNCVELETKKYKERASPPYHARECPNKIKKGNDNRLWISLRSFNTGIYKWQLYSKDLLEKREKELVLIKKDIRDRRKERREKKKKNTKKRSRSRSKK